MLTGIKHKNIEIVIENDTEDIKKHFSEDYDIILKEGIDKLIKENFIPWLKEEYFKEKDNEKIFDGLNIYSITYNYNKVIAKYSPTGEDDYFGIFEFDFESSNEYTSNILEAAAMEVYIHSNKIVKVTGYEI